MTAYDPIRLPEVPDEVNNELGFLLDVLRKKSRRNLIRSAYYDGRRAIKDITAVVPPQYHNLGITLGWNAKAVDLLARRCNLDSFTWADGNIDDLGYREVWDENSLRTESNQVITSSLEHSTAFVVTTLGGNGEPKGLMQFLDATQATGRWNARARRLDSFLAITGRGGDNNNRITKLALYLPNVVYTARLVDGTWVVDSQPHPWGVPADPLPYHPRLKRPFGSSRISRATMSLQDAAVRALIRLEGHMDVYSFPEVWMLGADQSIFKNPDGSIKASWQVMLGRVKGIPDDDMAENPRADVKQFQAASPEPHLADLNALAKLFARESQLPDTALAITDVSNPTSAESYDASQYEIIAEAEGATDDWTPGLARAFRRTLAIRNGFTAVPDEWLTITPQWRNPRFLSRSAEADAGSKQVAAVPWLADTQVGLELLGLSPDQVDRAVAEKRRGSTSTTLQSLAALAAESPTAEGSTSSDGEASTSTGPDATQLKAQFDALGIAIRAGVDPADAATRLGLDGIKFTGAVPVALRMPEAEASSLEER